MMIVSYPNNPTCAIAPDSFYEELIAFAKKYDIVVLHDNAYSELVFDGKVGKSFLSFAGAKEVGIELNSFSKTYGMAGARLGVCVGNKEVIECYNTLKSNMDYGIFLPVQYAGIEALRHGGASIHSTCQAYQDRRDVKYLTQSDGILLQVQQQCLRGQRFQINMKILMPSQKICWKKQE